MSRNPVAFVGRAQRSSVVVAATEMSVRTLDILLGICLTLAGLLSIVLPFIPTITTLLASSFFLDRGLPRLQSLVKELPIIGKFIKYLDGTKIMTPKARVTICAYLWVNLLVTCVSLYGIGAASYSIVSINFFCCALTTIFVHKYHAPSLKISQAKSEGRVNAGESNSDENQLLNGVHAISKEINESLGGLPHTSSASDLSTTSN